MLPAALVLCCCMHEAHTQRPPLSTQRLAMGESVMQVARSASLKTSLAGMRTSISVWSRRAVTLAAQTSRGKQGCSAEAAAEEGAGSELGQAAAAQCFLLPCACASAGLERINTLRVWCRQQPTGSDRATHNQPEQSSARASLQQQQGQTNVRSVVMQEA